MFNSSTTYKLDSDVLITEEREIVCILVVFGYIAYTTGQSTKQQQEYLLENSDLIRCSLLYCLPKEIDHHPL